jgi:spore maturation protein CgeB
MNVQKVSNIGFCGNITDRKFYLELLKKYFNIKTDIFVIGEDMVRAINSYKIHFNKNIGIDINYRNFETIGCRVALMTNYNDQYRELGFLDGENCMIYKNEQELLEKVRLLIDNQDLLDKISNNGYVLSKEHTYTKRMETLIEVIKNGK